MTKNLIESIFGVYEPFTNEIVDAEGNISSVIVSGVSGVDWSYVLGVLLFGLTLFCVLRILGAVISRV